MNIVLLDDSGCNVHLIVNETKQYFATEGYPNKYKPLQYCQFNFVAPIGRKFIVLFEDFNLEERYDFLHFRKLHTMQTHTHTHTHTHAHSQS